MSVIMNTFTKIFCGAFQILLTCDHGFYMPQKKPSNILGNAFYSII